MKFEIAPETLAEELAAICGIVESKSQMAAHQYVLIDTQGKYGQTYLKLTVTNGVMQAESYILGTWPTPVEMCVSARKLLNLAKLLDGGVLKTEQDAKTGNVKMQHGKSHFKLGAIASSLFPRMSGEYDDPVTLPGQELRSLIQLTRGFIGEDDSRFAFSGGKLELSLHNVSLIGTDGVRMAQATAPHVAGEQYDDMEMLVPHKALIQLSNMIGRDDEEVKMAVARNKDGIVTKLKFRIGNRFLTTNTTNGAFPDVDAVLEAHDKVMAEVEVDKHELLDALKRTLIVNEDKNRIVQIFVGDAGEELALSTDGVDSGQDRIITKNVTMWNESQFGVGLNGDHLTQFLVVVKEAAVGDNVLIKYSGLNRFVELNPAESGNVNFRYLVAPTRPLTTNN